MRKTTKRIVKVLLRSVLVLLAMLATYALAAWLLGIMSVNSGYAPPQQGVDIYIKSNPAHVDVVLPMTHDSVDWADFVPVADFEAARNAHQFIAFGWGDKGFYLNTPTWADLTASTAINAVLLPSESAMHVTLYENVPREGELCRKIRISETDYAKLVAFVKSGFALNDGNSVQRLECTDYPGINDRFFEGTGSYSGLKTCNVWTNNALKAAGVNTAVWAPFKEAIFYHRPAIESSYAKTD